MGQNLDCMTETRVSISKENSQRSPLDSAESPRQCAGLRQASWRVIPATIGDQPAILQLLVSVFHRPSPVDFHAQQEDPSYEPSDRLLIKSGRTIVAHLRVVHREMHFGNLNLPVGLITDVATLPEFRHQGCATALLAAAREALLRQGAVLGLLRTEVPRFYARRGWVVCGRHSYAVAGPREILSCLNQRETAWAQQAEFALDRTPRPSYGIRIWRQVELAALRRLYSENTQGSYGALVRSDAYWQWLVRRGGNEQIYVAIAGPDRCELDDRVSPIVAYAATREGRVLELMCSPEHPEAASQLLVRVCGEAIERDFHHVRLDSAPNNPLPATFLAAGGMHARHEVDKGLVFMANVYRPRRLLKLLAPTLIERVRAAEIRCPCQLGLLVNEEKYRLVVSRRQVQFMPGAVGRSYLRCTSYDIAQLLLGHLDIHEALSTGRLTASTGVAAELAAALFPRLPLWRPPWDELPASS
jgi:GNAT superfamily N-acetyltransferase